MDSGSNFGRIYITLKLNDVDSQLSPMSYSLTEFDSIYQFYPKLKFMSSDKEGALYEVMAFINGTQMEVIMGNSQETSKRCKFVIAKNAVPQQKVSDGIGGDIETELIHDYYRYQYKHSKAWQSNISDIIKEVIKNYPFDDVDIETTYNSGLWYQPNITDSEFIVNNLSPFAYSTSSQNTPFFTFIDSNNVFHFKSFKSMFESTPVKELTYYINGLNAIANDKSLSSVCFSQLEYSKIKPMLNTSYYMYDKKGDLNIKNDTILDYITTKGKYPLISDLSKTTNVLPLYDEDIKLDDTDNNNKGFLINKHKEIILPDKIIINTILDKSLVCGKTVKINLPNTFSNSSGDFSSKSSGIYLIESSYHFWENTNKSSRTMLICSKQNLTLPTNYRNYNMLIN